MENNMNILYRDIKAEQLIDMFSQEYRDILDKQEPFSVSEVNAKCNNAINKLNVIKNHIKLLQLLDNLEKKYDSDKLVGDVIEILEEIQLNSIDIEKIRKILNAP